MKERPSTHLFTALLSRGFLQVSEGGTEETEKQQKDTKEEKQATYLPGCKACTPAQVFSEGQTVGRYCPRGQGCSWKRAGKQMDVTSTLLSPLGEPTASGTSRKWAVPWAQQATSVPSQASLSLNPAILAASLYLQNQCHHQRARK